MQLTIIYVQSVRNKARIEIHLTEAEVKALDKIAELDGRSRKNFCETEIRKIVQSLMQANVMNTFPKFWYESNAVWGNVKSIEDLREKMHHQTNKR